MLLVFHDVLPIGGIYTTMFNVGMIAEKIALIIVIGLVIYTVWIFLISRFGTRQNSAVHILKERYARGEIDDDEFQKRMNRLK